MLKKTIFPVPSATCVKYKNVVYINQKATVFADVKAPVSPYRGTLFFLTIFFLPQKRAATE
jgi:hypothetical protein